MPTTTRKQTPAQARKAALESDYAPLYAVAGLTDAVAAGVQQRVAALQAKEAEVERQARTSAEELAAFVKSLPETLKALPEVTKARLAEAQRQAQALVTGATATYGDLAGRGKRRVDETLVVAKGVSAKAEQRAEDAFADVADAVDPAFEKVQEGVTIARKTVTGRTATETVTPRSAAKASATRKVATAEKAAPAKKVPAAKKAPAKKAPAKKAPVKAG